jgi:hypothetical protein
MRRGLPIPATALLVGAPVASADTGARIAGGTAAPGSYLLRLQRTGAGTIRYEAIKAVVKQPLGTPSDANPVLRRDEVCTGQLTR